MNSICSVCPLTWTLSPEVLRANFYFFLGSHQVAKIPGLDILIKCCSHYSPIHLDGKSKDRPGYRPWVDEILRAKRGVNFETAVNVQGYIVQLLETWKGGPQSEPLKASRRKLRRDIVQRAQEIWQRTTLTDGEAAIEQTGNPSARRRVTAKRIIVHTRERWAPTSVLSTFLFPARLLSSSKLWLPYDPDEHWLKDPTLDLGTSRDVLRVGADWIDRKAREMVQELVIYKPDEAVTSWIRAAEQWHVERIKHDLDSGKYLNLDYGGVRLRRPEDVATAGNNRLDVIAKKLRIDPLFPVGTLTEHEKRMAVACFNKLIRHRCAGCPVNNLLILPCGLEEIVRHYGEYHPYDFWLNDRWTIRG